MRFVRKIYTRNLSYQYIFFHFRQSISSCPRQNTDRSEDESFLSVLNFLYVQVLKLVLFQKLEKTRTDLENLLTLVTPHHKLWPMQNNDELIRGICG